MQQAGVSTYPTSQTEELSQPRQRRRSRDDTQARSPAKSRRKASVCEGVCAPSDGYALVSTFDAPGRPIEVSLSLLRDFQCRLCKIVERDAPAVDKGSRRVHQAGPAITRVALVSALRSMACGELVVGKDTTVNEVLSVLQYEGVSVANVGSVHKLRDLPQLDAPVRGLVHSRQRGGNAQVELSKLCTQIALAIAHWPRLDAGLCAAVEGRPSCGFECSATRCWLQFVFTPLPKGLLGARTNGAGTGTAGDPLEALAQRWPRWLSALVTVLEILHARRLRAPGAPVSDYSEALFKDITREHNGDELGRFCLHRFDVPSGDTTRGLTGIRREISEAKVAAANVRMLAQEPLPNTTQSGGIDQRVLWARAAVAFGDETASRTPNLSALFDSQFGEETVERKALAKALRPFGVRVLSWAANNDPVEGALVFPTHYNFKGARGPSCLLYFDTV